MHNVNSMMYVGEKPWHGLGTKLNNVATAAEAIAAAGLDWKVEKKELFLANGKQVDGSLATVRNDTGAVLGVVGDIYRPLQNKEAFSFFDAIVGSKEAMYHTAGALGTGERVWILAKLPGQIRVIGDDVTDKFLLLTNTHDGTAAVNMMFTPIRVVCQNTLNVAVSEASRTQKVRHSASIGMRIEDVRKGLGIVSERFRMFEEAAQAMTKVQVNGEQWRELLKSVGIIPADEHAKMTGRARNIMDEVTDFYTHGKGQTLPGVKGTAWAAFNGISEYVDYARATKGEDKAQSRAASLLFGSGATLKQKAWDAAMALTR